jgi:hypothetical protein
MRQAQPPLLVPAAGTQYPRARVVLLERIGWVSDYWVPAFAGTTPNLVATMPRLKNG